MRFLGSSEEWPVAVTATGILSAAMVEADNLGCINFLFDNLSCFGQSGLQVTDSANVISQIQTNWFGFDGCIRRDKGTRAP